ncbi:MAG: hypothetical protein RR304_09775, partial [Bacteroides sp.]
RKKESNIQLLEVNLIALPYSWEWTRLGTISNYGESPSVPAHQIASDAWILDLEDIEKGTGAILRKVLKKERDSASAKRPFVSGQLLYSKLRPYLNKVLVAPAHGFCTSEILPVQLYGRCAPKYLRAFCRSPFFLEYANRCSYGVKMPRLGTRDGKKALIALPPLREQQRIAQVIDRINIVLESTK